MKKTVAVFFGGRSPEHDISIITALSSIIKPLELTKKYNVFPVYITKDGKWFGGSKLKDIKTFRTGEINNFCKKSKPLSVTFNGGMFFKKVGLGNKDVNVDIAFPAMHGAYGEDGSLMGLIRMAGIPFVGCDMAASVIAMDKVLAKQLAIANDIPTPRFISFSKFEFESNKDLIIKKVMNSLAFPQFVKPSHLGSSIGITKVNNKFELLNAIEVAAYYDDKILIEEAVNNLIEVTVPIIGNEIMTPALVERPLSHDDKFFDFDTKYMSGGKKGGGKKTSGSQGYSELPAKLPNNMYSDSIKIAEAVYRGAGCEGIARVDLLIDSKSETIYFNEINPLPGSLYNHNWRASGISPVELVERLIELAEARFTRDKKIETTFESSFLKQF